jgi:hypothetical protein
MPCLIARCASNKDDHSSSDDDDFNDDDSWIFVPHERANAAQDLAPLGESVVVDLVPNLDKHGPTASSHFKCHVLVTDARWCKPQDP